MREATEKKKRISARARLVQDRKRFFDRVHYYLSRLDICHCTDLNARFTPVFPEEPQSSPRHLFPKRSYDSARDTLEARRIPCNLNI